MFLVKLFILVPVHAPLRTRDYVLELRFENALSLFSFGLAIAGSRLASFNGGNVPNRLIGQTVHV